MFVAGCVDIVFLFGALERQIPSRHVPTNGKHFIVVNVETAAQHHYHTLFAVAHWEIAVVHIESLHVHPVAVLVFALLHHLLVNVGFTHIVEQTSHYHAVFWQFALHFGAHLNDLFAKHQASAASVERMLHITAVARQVETRARRSIVKAQIFEVFNQIVGAFTTHTAE